ncbi:hypothetical protein DTO169E5_1291 [Paecilomyces variotii]|nr:hypothetical protein DTO169C6_6581 [Paecilomyces variotii]KAJ9244910.1 hypothetical protein DTO169E5_1291 [Paecilomyces variotii]
MTAYIHVGLTGSGGSRGGLAGNGSSGAKLEQSESLTLFRCVESRLLSDRDSNHRAAAVFVSAPRERVTCEYSVRPEASYFRQKPLSIVFIEEELQKGRSPLTLLRLIRPGLLPGLSSPNSAGGGFTDVTASH